MFGYESSVDADYSRYCGPERCEFCGDEMMPGHDPRECERKAMEEMMSESNSTRKLEVSHQHHRLGTLRKRVLRCYWAIWEQDGSPDGTFVAEIETSHADAVAMAKAIGSIVSGESEEKCTKSGSVIS